jgi:hypothetical protein
MEILQLPALTSLLSGEYPASELNSAGLRSSLYSLGADPTEKPKQFFYFCYRPLPSDTPDLVDVWAATKQRVFVLSIVAQQRYYMLQYLKDE